VLVIGTGLLGRSLLKLLAVDPGFRTTKAVVLDVAIGADDSLAHVRRAAFYRELLRRLATIPGVTAVGAVNTIPLAPVGLSSGNFIQLTSPEERIRPEDVMRLFQDHARSGNAEYRAASEGYFQAMHIPLLEGRTFDDQDVPDAATDVAVVSASLLREQWPGQSPIGKWIQFGNMDGDTRPFRIVGVVGDVHERGLDTPPAPTFYADYLQRPVITGRMNIVLAGAADPRAVTATATSILRDLRPDVPPRFRTIESIVAASVAGRRLVLVLVGLFALVAVGLAALGLYSVISYLVAQRTQELRVRIALGAREADIVRLVLGEGSALAATGIAIGTVVAFVGTRLLTSLLYGTSATDVLAFGSSALGVALASFVACWLPAHRAARAAGSGVVRR
jgi:predicted permease